MSRIDDDGISTSIYQCLHALQCVAGDAYASSHTQTTLLVLASHRLILGLGDILIGDEAYEVVVLIHHGQLLNLVLLQNLSSSSQVGLLMGGYEILVGHYLVNLLVKPTFEAQVAVRDNTYQTVVVVDNGNATDMIFCHNVESILHR